jgi:hypothetical protein
MKKYLQILLVLALGLGVIALARSGPAWAGFFRPASDPVLFSPLIPSSIVNAPLTFEATIDEGVRKFNIGGVCLFDVDFKNTRKEMKVEADARVSLGESRRVPFTVPGFDLYFPGCRFIHYQRDTANGDFEITRTVSTADAEAKVCFGANPDYEMRIYYYFDLPGAPRTWAQLNTWLEDSGRLVCANARHSAVYMPAGRIDPRPGSEVPGMNPLFPGGVGGTVLPPPSRIFFAASGEYAVGGVCIIRADYRVRGLSNEVFVAFEEEQTERVPFPGYEDGYLFYFPGCHVVHYRNAELRSQMNVKIENGEVVLDEDGQPVPEQEGEWEICFAERPGREMLIYYYQDDLDDVTPPWKPLETTVENGLACAKVVDFTAIYTPAGR